MALKIHLVMHMERCGVSYIYLFVELEIQLYKVLLQRLSNRPSTKISISLLK
jgi:hypothetical protein